MRASRMTMVFFFSFLVCSDALAAPPVPPKPQAAASALPKPLSENQCLALLQSAMRLKKAAPMKDRFVGVSKDKNTADWQTVSAKGLVLQTSQVFARLCTSQLQMHTWNCESAPERCKPDGADADKTDGDEGPDWSTSSWVAVVAEDGKALTDIKRFAASGDGNTGVRITFTVHPAGKERDLLMLTLEAGSGDGDYFLLTWFDVRGGKLVPVLQWGNGTLNGGLFGIELHRKMQKEADEGYRRVWFSVQDRSLSEETDAGAPKPRTGICAWRNGRYQCPAGLLEPSIKEGFYEDFSADPAK